MNVLAMIVGYICLLIIALTVALKLLDFVVFEVCLMKAVYHKKKRQDE